MCWLPRVCSYELLELLAPGQEKSIDVSFISISYLGRELGHGN